MAVDNTSLERWRTLKASQVLSAIAEYAKQDSTFTPAKDARTTRWHATVDGQDFELLCTGAKFWDCRAERGGGGAVDMAMYLLGLDFKSASALLGGLDL